MQLLKKIISVLFSRLFLVGLMLVAQLVVIFASVMVFSQELLYVSLLFQLLSCVIAVHVVSTNVNPSYKITWIFAILMFPVVGWMTYFLFGNKRMPAKLRRRIDAQLESVCRHMGADPACQRILAEADPHMELQSRYVYSMTGYPAFGGTASEYYPVGEKMYLRMLEKLRGAQRFIFLEYFIIRPGKMWDAIFAILREKAASGVEVRLMYDDLGSIGTMPKRRRRAIRDAGIRLHVFNPFRPRISVILNYRDHRKLCVIDGSSAFCGGINLADEYINEVDRFGHWKDTGVLLEGEAVWPLTFMFLQQWQFSTDEFIDFDRYRGRGAPVPGDGLVQPFGDSPLDRDNVTEVAYLNIISQATNYVYITTPYLVIDSEMESALCAAAQSGVDVRIITPYRYDKWYVHTLTRSHYAQLIRAGVKIYEYTPGFMHGKMFVSDDNICMVGTCNMDFRSFYLHFECSVMLYRSRLLCQVKKDMLDCQSISRLITLEEAEHVPLGIRILRATLKLFAPLM